MRVINLETAIAAPRERVFDLARSIEAHLASTARTGERAIDGVTSGLIGAGQTVTWEARHFGVRQRLTVRITQFDRPRMFEDEMVRGAFRHFRHAHRFEECGALTVMHDWCAFSAPLGPLGWLAERLFLTRSMTGFLHSRAQYLKHAAESEAWSKFLPA